MGKKKNLLRCSTILITITHPIKETQSKNRTEEDTGIAASDHENAGGGRNVLLNKGAKSRVSLVPVEGPDLVGVSGVPVEGVAVVVGVAARHIPVQEAAPPRQLLLLPFPNLAHSSPKPAAIPALKRRKESAFLQLGLVGGRRYEKLRELVGESGSYSQPPVTASIAG